MLHVAPPFVDIHCHLLPDMDDGAADWPQSLAMARMAAADGISTVIVTPHQLGAYCTNRAEAILAQTATLQQRLDLEGVALRVLPGADVRIEPGLVHKLQRREVLTLADRGRHVLLELPHELYFPLERLLSELRSTGMVGILSHPERNRGILARRNVLASVVEAGGLLQVTAGSLVGTFGPEVERFSRWLVQQRWVHFVATDAHGAKSRRPLLRRAFDCVASLTDEPTAVQWCCHNPGAVVAGQDIGSPAKESTQSGLRGWFRHRRAG